MESKLTAAARYDALLQYRNAYQQAAYNSAALTIPALVPHETDNGDQDDRTRATLHIPAQSLGARGVNNLAAKLLLALFPPNAPLFRYVIDASVKSTAQGEELNAANSLLSEREAIINADIESGIYKPKLSEAFKQLIVAGNVLLLLDDAKMRVFRLDRYVVKRGPMGEVVEVVVKESLDRSTLSPEIYKLCASEDPDFENKDTAKDDDEPIALYTWIKRKGNRFIEHQEVKGQKVPGSEGSFPIDSPRWLPLTFTRCDGEDYGRGMVEELIGDLTTFNALNKAIREDAAIGAHTVFAVDPNSPPGLERTLNTAPNGGYVRCEPTAVIPLRADKTGDLRVGFQVLESLKTDLSFMFLLNSAVQRSGDRVTATEIQQLARELETTQSGLYSVLAEELVLPVVVAHERELEKGSKIAPLPNGMVRPTIVTGLDALGRSGDLIKLQGVLGDVGALAQMDPSAAQLLNSKAVVQAIFEGHSVVADGKIKSEEQLQQEQQAAQQQQQQAQTQEMMGGVVEGVAPEMAKGLMTPQQ